MFLERKENGGKRNMTGAAAGYDLSDSVAQISYCLPGVEKPETISQVAGEEQFLIPAMLAKRTDRDLWLYGQQALSGVERGEALPVNHLLSGAVAGDPVEVDGEEYDPVALLSLFLKRTLSLLTPVFNPSCLQALVFTVEEVTMPVIEALTGAAALLELKEAKIYVIGRAESFFYYNISQPEELWRHEVLLCDFTAAQLRTLLFSANRRTMPAACFVEEQDWPKVCRRTLTGDEDDDNRSGMLLDQQLCAAAEKMLSDRTVDTVYLIGEGFAGEWYQESVKALCQGRRVFLGNNLYSKGACYAARERLCPGGISGSYAFLGKDMLKANVGMHAVCRGSDAYLALLDAGVNWYEAAGERDFLLEEKNSFSLRITPVNGKEVREVLVTLTGLPVRPARTTRIHLKVDMTDKNTVRISMEDLGFGEFFPATHKFWEESFLV